MIRRDVLRLGSAAAVAALLHGPSQARMIGTPPIAIFDGRYSDARMFAEAARTRGALAFDSSGDVASLWHETGFPRDGATAVIGLTTYADLLMMSDLARDTTLRRGFHAMHDARGSAQVRHLAEDTASRAPDFHTGPAWPIALADCLNGAAGQARGDRASGPRSADHPGTLWSWMYEPAPRS